MWYNLLVTVRPFLRFLLRAVLLALFVAFVVAALQGPVRLAWLLHRGAYFEAHKEYARAIAVYEQALELRSQVTSHLRIGEIYLTQGRYELAAQEFEEAHRLDPSSDEALLGIGSAAFALGEEGKAMRCWSEALAVNLTNAEAHYRLGRAYLGRSQWSLAQEELEKATRYGEGEARFYLGLLLAREDRELAILHLEEVVEKESALAEGAAEVISILEGLTGAEDEASVAAKLGHMYLGRELPTLAQEQLTKAVSLDPEQHLARSYLGYVLWSLGEYEEARGVLREALRLQPESALNHLVRGMLNRSQGWLVAALVEFQKALELDPENAAICAEMASTYLEKRDYPAAREWYRAAVERAPGEVEFHLLRAEFHLEHLLWLEDGLAAAQMAVALDPQNGVAYDLLGWAQYLLRRPEARASLEKAVALDPESASAHYHLGLAYAQEGLNDLARWAYERAIDLDTEGFYRERAQKALKELAPK